jgi:type II secretory ATPase GspE/PulE/Tfp pilus assembly ATPase PilB-like protein
LADQIPLSIAREHGFVPIHDAAGTLTVAVGEPLSREIVDKLTFILNRDIQTVIHSRTAVELALRDAVGWRKRLYTYKGMTTDGTDVVGTVEAYDLSYAQSEVEQMGLFQPEVAEQEGTALGPNPGSADARPADGTGRLPRIKLILEIAAVAVGLIGSVIALVWRSK